MSPEDRATLARLRTEARARVLTIEETAFFVRVSRASYLAAEAIKGKAKGREKVPTVTEEETDDFWKE